MREKLNKADVVKDWYEQYGQSLYRSMCAAAKNADDAGEISQEAFLKVAVKVMNEDETSTIENPKAFLYRVAYNELYKRYNKKKHEAHLQGTLTQNSFELADTINPEREVASREELSVVQHAIAALPRKQQQVFRLSREEQLPHKEIGKRLGIETSTVKRHIIRALAALRGVHKDYLDG